MESTEKLNAKNSAALSTAYINIVDSIFQECPDGIVYKDKDLRYMVANEAFYKLYKISSPKNFIGQKELPFLSGENLKLISSVNSAIVQELRPVSYVMALKNKPATDRIMNITSFPILCGGEFQGIVSIVKDVTNEENIKENFVSKHFKLKSLFENIPMLIYMQDKLCNYIAGTKPSQNFVKEGYDALSDIHIDYKKNQIEEFEENNYVIDTCKTLVKEKLFEDFKEISHWYKIYKVPIIGYDGSTNGVITVATNIDAEKQLQKQREAFVASIGHDLKNPTIAQIRGLELLIKGTFGEINKEQKELAEMVLDSCRYMNGMLSTLLATYRNFDGVAKLKFAEFSFKDLVTECVSEMIYVAKDKNIEIVVNNKAEDTINADRVQLKRVIMNLLSNGIKYAYKNTLLKISIYTENGKNCFEFENSSPYIPPVKQKTIFGQYVSYASLHNEIGTGLGLYTSKKIIEAHNGKIYVQSLKEDKNIFGFKIPIQPKPDEEKDIRL